MNMTKKSSKHHATQKKKRVSRRPRKSNSTNNRRRFFPYTGDKVFNFYSLYSFTSLNRLQSYQDKWNNHIYKKLFD